MKIANGTVHAYPDMNPDKSPGWPLHKHQEEAIRIGIQGKSYVLTSAGRRLPSGGPRRHERTSAAARFGRDRSRHQGPGEGYPRHAGGGGTMSKRNKSLAVREPSSPGPAMANLLKDIRSLIETARAKVAQAANAGLSLLYWNVGRRIRQDILGEKRAGYGEKIVQTLSAQLVRDYGQGFSRRNIFNMVRFAGIRVAEYMTELPPRKILEKKLHDAIRLARERLVAAGKRPEADKQ